MGTGRVTLGALLLVLVSTVLQVSTAGDIYLEGEEDNQNEFLEVKEDDIGILGHLHRIKRGFLGNFLGSDPDEETATEGDDGYGKDDDVDNFGSGAVDKGDPESREKTLRVTFTANEPYSEAYSDRDSAEFREFSRSLASSVDKLYETLPGTQRTSLVRIQSHIADEFSCKVTLDIVTSGYENIENIENLLRNHIKIYHRLGKTTVSDSDFSSQLIDPGSTFCEENEYQCDEHHCLQLSTKCDGIPHCNDGTDEQNCPISPDASENGEQTDTYPESSSTTETNVDQGSEASYDQEPESNGSNPADEYQNPEDKEFSSDPNNFDQESEIQNTTSPDTYDPSSSGSDNSNANDYNDNEEQKPDEQSSSGVFPSEEENEIDNEPQRGDGGRHDETSAPTSATEETPISSGTAQGQPQTPSGNNQVEITTSSPINEPYDCQPGFLRCDETRCVEQRHLCDGQNNCDDGADEANCPAGKS